MKWFYFIRNKPWTTNGTACATALYLRPYRYDEDNKLMVGKVVDITLVALDCVFESDEYKEHQIKTQDIYHNKLANSPYYFENMDIPSDEQPYFLGLCQMFVKKSFDQQRLMDLMKSYLDDMRYPFLGFTETDYEHFASDVNPMARFFSRETFEQTMKENEEIFKYVNIPGLFTGSHSD